jgi:hypothetical protein
MSAVAYSAAGAPVCGTDTFALRSLMRVALPVRWRIAGEVAQVVQLGATHAAATHDLDVGEHRAVQREYALDTDAVGDLPHGEGGAHPRATARDADPLECLNALLLTFLDAYVHAQGVAGTERRHVGAEPLFLGFDEGMHMTLGAEGARV